MFEAAADFSQREIKQYRLFSFSPALGEQTHNPFFPVEDATSWMTLMMLSEEYQNHPFFSLENTERWINPAPFQAFMKLEYGLPARGRGSSPFSSHTSSRAVSRSASRASSRLSIYPSSRASSPISLVSGISTRPPSSMSMGAETDFDNGDLPRDAEASSDAHSPEEAPPPPPPILIVEVEHPAPRPKKRKRKVKPDTPSIVITRQEKVDLIVGTTVQTTWSVPRTRTAYHIDGSDSLSLFTTKTGRALTLDAYIRSKDQDSWKGSTGHTKGDVQVYNLGPDPETSILCRRAQLYCNGVDVCEFIDPKLFEGCERYEPDIDEMRELWNHELDANENEAASASGIISRFYSRVVTSKCKIKCEGVPTLIIRSKHNGHFSNDPGDKNEFCVLTVHPRVGLSQCPYSHIVDGQVRPARMKRQACPTEMLIFFPVDKQYNTRAIVILRNAHNHPAHPHTKPTANDKAKLESAIQVAVLDTAPSNLIQYDGTRVAQSSPAFMDTRKVRDVITQEKKKEHPRGMGWDGEYFCGVLYELEHREMNLPPDERYIHTAMSKNGFRIVATMHPYITMFIHRLLSLNIDYTFARVDDNMDEWEVAGFLDRFKHRLTFGSLYCDKKDRAGFAQLFTELFDTIREITGKILKIRPFYPEANCRVVIMDGEVPQAQGFGDFLSNYNDPDISKIYTRNWEKLLGYILKTCNPHFIRHIDKLGPHIPKETIARLKSILGLDTQEKIDYWYQFADEQTDEKIRAWLAHKRANPWVLPSVNKFLSKISADDWDITPNHTNYAETAHAGRNAETSVGVPVLTAILQSKERDNIRATEMALIESDGDMRKRWNGIREREKHATQRKGWKMRKAYQRDDALMDYDSLLAERNSGDTENKASLERQNDLEVQIKALKAEIALEKHRTDLPAQVADLRRDIDKEKALRREWGARRKAINTQIDTLKKGKLAGVRVNGRRPTTATTLRAGEETAPSSSASQDFNSGGMLPDILADPDPVFNTEYTMHDADESAITENPAAPDNDVDFTANVQTMQASHAISYEGPENVPAMEHLPVAENSIPNFQLIAEPGFFPANDSMHLSEFDLIAFDEFLAAFPPGTVDVDSVTENHSGKQNDGFEYGIADTSSSTRLMLSQELPRLPPPPRSPSLSDVLEDTIVGPINDESHDRAAPRDIDLEFSERNIISGKRRRTQSTRLADAAVARSKKRGARIIHVKYMGFNSYSRSEPVKRNHLNSFLAYKIVRRLLDLSRIDSVLPPLAQGRSLRANFVRRSDISSTSYPDRRVNSRNFRYYITRKPAVFGSFRTDDVNGF
ncbi:hypothetical protein C8R45DRAFT_933816 [Mycena sanguinolenta]|nr:hypothetical protein C8R45DRAFT_933816 [Mycena sanguinolenta]